jgi:DNA ligase 1
MEFAHLARTFEELERTSSRLTLIELVTQLFRSIEQPEEIQQVCYLMQGRVAPFYEALEMGMAEKSVAKAIALASHTTPEQIEALYGTLGDLGLVAGQVRSEAKDAPSALSIDDVFEKLRAIAHTSGKGAVEHKSARLVSLLRQVDSVSAKYVVRILLGNLRAWVSAMRRCLMRWRRPGGMMPGSVNCSRGPITRFPTWDSSPARSGNTLRRKRHSA